MKLSQLFSGEVRAEGPSQPQLTPAQTEHLNRQIRSLAPGQTISGEIVGRNGSEVQIRLSEDLILNARVDRNMNIEIGKNMTFEVKNNGSTLTLSPLFTNVATDVNVMKALDMAGLPLNQTSVSMTEQLMAVGLPVNKNSLQQIFREINAYPQAEISDIINLHKLQLPVNEANVNQMVSYRNLTHQLTGGMEVIQEALPGVFDSMIAEGDISGAVKLYSEILQLFQENSGEGTQTGEVPGGGNAAGDAGLPWAEETGSPGAAEPGRTGMSGEVQTEAAVREQLGKVAEATGKTILNMVAGETGDTSGRSENPVKGDPLMQPAAEESGNLISEALRSTVAREVLQLADRMQLPEGTASQIREQILQFARGEGDIRQFFSALTELADGARFSQTSAQALERIFSGRAFRELMKGQLKNNWMLRPEELTEPGKVEELYRRMDRQLKSLANVMENAGQTNSAAFKAVATMSQNVDFLQQVNQIYAYVQLPLRLQQGEAHGELYVYTNKKKLTSGDGTVSALLHLDMEHLGPVDVHVAMKDSKVSTRFYLRDEEMIDFIAAHMDTLTARLKKRGYDCNYSMTVRAGEEPAAEKGGLNPILRQEKGIVLSQYAFDVRT
ncbi:flagellar hook-length control protein FliK [Acetatifactor muris]|uniref:Flagellar hook-length control protein FliK n=1 Tax=Acetatifactor muris TaxID=879566 RepID=A0A2K4ZDM7_9FIRM|nr:flagellar hook-length control protein FliK [Acetatifactor muris]MCR2046848.1 flagellar hook-length control protein FliK [Acetatifactor muris]SOY28566.1 Flagellar hook-length control protein FliK [Acetatifactor muris]